MDENKITLEFDDGGVVDCEILGLFDVKGVEYIAIAESRKHLSWYTKGLNGATRARCEINSAKTFEEMKSILDNLI